MWGGGEGGRGQDLPLHLAAAAATAAAAAAAGSKSQPGRERERVRQDTSWNPGHPSVLAERQWTRQLLSVYSTKNTSWYLLEEPRWIKWQFWSFLISRGGFH